MSTLFQTDAIELLTQDHREVSELFEKYEEMVEEDAGQEIKGDLAALICHMLTVHTTIEEEILYPAARSVLEDEGMIDEAYVEHQAAKDLIEQILAMDPSDELYDAKVKVLGEQIDHHVAEEEDKLFPELEESGMDLDSVGAELSVRKEELMAAIDDEAEAG
jgi:hemerythrin superfamily protein